MTTSKDYKDKAEALKAELAAVEKAEKKARYEEKLKEAAAQRAAYDKELEDAINAGCYDTTGFKKKYPHAYEDALAHAKEVCDGEDVEVIADELSIIMGIVERAVDDLLKY